jgi:hypothetical protein
MYNMDDSPASTGCYPRTGSESFCAATPGMKPVTAASQSAYLPSGHRLSYVMRHKGDAICHVSTPNFRLDRATGGTYCIRHYRRWDAASEMPGPAGPGGAEPQQKISTVSGCADTGSGCRPEGGIKVQFSIPPTTNGVAGHISGGSDTHWTGLPAASPDFGNVRRDCTNNFCRFEACIDFGTDGYFQSRRRMVEVGSGEVHPPGGSTLVGNVSRPSANYILTFNGGLMLFGQFTPGIIDYATHFIVAQLPYKDSTFWPGPACEVEGGCRGIPPPPPPPDEPPPASPPAAPILLP